jgi:hypothetical protein
MLEDGLIKSSSELYKIKRIFLAVLTIIIILFCRLTTAKADEIRIGVTPMYFNNIDLKKGQSTDLNLSVLNNSIFAEAKDSSKRELYSYEVNIKPIDKESEKYKNLSEEEKGKVLASKWITLNSSDFKLVPEESNNIAVNIKVPQDATVGEHIAILNITRIPINNSINGISMNINIAFTVQVPIFINVLGEGVGVSQQSLSCKIEEFDMSDELESTSISDLLTGLIKIDSGLKDRWSKFLYNPIKIKYGAGEDERIIYDIPKAVKVTLRNTITTDKNKKGDTKYVIFPNNLKDSDPINKFDFNKNQIIIYSGKNTYPIDFPNETIVNSIKEQINNLASSISGVPNVKWFLDTIKVSKRVNQTEVRLYATYTIKNTGNRTIIPSGTLDIFNENNTKVDSINYGSVIVTPNDTKKIIGTLIYDPSKYSDGEYHISSKIVPYENAKTITAESKFKIEKIRIFIILGMITVIIVILIMIGIVIKNILKKKSKREKKELVG